MKEVNKVAANNVHYVMDEIPERSPILKDMVQKAQIAIVGGMYDVETGKIKFFEHTGLIHEHQEMYVVDAALA